MRPYRIAVIVQSDEELAARQVLTTEDVEEQIIQLLGSAYGNRIPVAGELIDTIAIPKRDQAKAEVGG